MSNVSNPFPLTFILQVVERVTIFVMDANDEKPEFKNMPAIIDVVEVSKPRGLSACR